MSSNPYNPQWLGYAAATDRQIMGGSAPFVYNYSSHDNQSCLMAKAIYNDTHAAIYSPDSTVRSHPAGNLIQGAALPAAEKAVHDVCTPSFSIDAQINYPALGMPSPSFS